MNTKDSVVLFTDRSIDDGWLKVTGTCHPDTDNQHGRYIESRSRMEYVGDITQKHIEDFWIDLLSRWPHLETFAAYMSRESLGKFVANGSKEVVVVVER